MNELVTILSSITFSGLLTGALVFLTRSWIAERLKNAIRHEYDQKLETHKAQLKADSDVAIEHLRSQLQIAASEQNVRFSQIFERTADTVASTYGRLWAIHEAFKNYVREPDSPNSAKKREIVETALREFRDYFMPRRILIPKEAAQGVEEFHKKLREAIIDVRIGVEEANNPGRSGVISIEVWKKTLAMMDHELPSLLEELDRDFRKTLGTIKDEQAS